MGNVVVIIVLIIIVIMIVKPVLDVSKDIKKKTEARQQYKESKPAPIRDSSVPSNSVVNIECSAPQVIVPTIASREIIQRKANWKDFKKILTDNNITKLYHFTDRANLESIRKNGGLLSWSSCNDLSIAIPKPGGNALSRDLDSNKGLQNYVRLSFVEDNPMKYVAMSDGRINDPVILEIDLEVIYYDTTIFTNQNAAKTGVVADSSLATFQSIRFHYFRYNYLDLYPDTKPYYQAEVLVAERIPIKLIMNIAKV
jgi:hypothetical protein